MKFLENLIDRIIGRSPDFFESDPEPEAAPQSRWVVDIPPHEGIRLGTFRTKNEALDYRREYIIRTIREAAEPIELPF